MVNQNPHTFVWFATEPKYVFCDHTTSNKNTEAYKELLTEKTISMSEVKFGAYCIYNFLYVGDNALLFNIPTRFYNDNENKPKKHQLLLKLHDGSQLAFCGSLGGSIYYCPSCQPFIK